MNEELPIEAQTDQREEKIKKTERSYHEIWIRRYEQLFHELPEGSGRTFAEFCDELQQGRLTEIAKELELAGYADFAATLFNDWNNAYEQGGATALAQFVVDLSERLDGLISPDNLVESNIVRGPLPQMAKVENGRFDPNGKFIALHIDSLFAHAGENIREKLRTELARIAMQIATEHPDTQAIVGESWMLDRPTNIIGFKVLDEYLPDQDGRAARSQLITKDGDIDQAQMEQYVKTGQLRHKSKFGYIPVEEFLAKYLPKEGVAKP